MHDGFWIAAKVPFDFASSRRAPRFSRWYSPILIGDIATENGRSSLLRHVIEIGQIAIGQSLSKLHQACKRHSFARRGSVDVLWGACFAKIYFVALAILTVSPSQARLISLSTSVNLSAIPLSSMSQLAVVVFTLLM
jgi:hypothetical protein